MQTVAEVAQAVETAVNVAEDLNVLKSKVLEAFSNSINDARNHMNSCGEILNTPKQQNSVSEAMHYLNNAFLYFHAALINL